MRIYQDLFTDEEFLSDSYKIELIHEEVIGEVQSRMIVKSDVEVDVGCGNAFGGQNEDDGDQGGQTGGAPVAKVIDLVDAFQYEETSFDLEGFNSYFKSYMKKLQDWVKANKPDRLEKFKIGALAFFKWAKANFDELSFYTGKSYDMENLIVMSYYKKPEDPAPTFLYVMDGMKSYKV
jgi:hypothetical protein